MDVVITDLDGSLLDHCTYSFAEALPALNLLKDKRIPLLYCSSKTRLEMEYWRRQTENQHPFIVENGGAVIIPTGYFQFPILSARTLGASVAVQLGDSYADLVECLKEAAAASGCSVRGFHDMTASEIAKLCDLSPSSALLAKAREFDEPFLILDNERTNELLAAIERKGKRWTRGGRFHHILGANDKAVAVTLLLDLYRKGGCDIRSIGIGDGLNDAPFLNVVDVPILIRTPWIEDLQAAVRRGRATDSPGSRGWNEAIMGLFA